MNTVPANNNLATHLEFQTMTSEAQRDHLANQIPLISERVGQFYNRVVNRYGEHHEATNAMRTIRDRIQEINLEEVRDHDLISPFRVVNTARITHEIVQRLHPAPLTRAELLALGVSPDMNDSSSSENLSDNGSDVIGDEVSQSDNSDSSEDPLAGVPNAAPSSTLEDVFHSLATR